MLRCGWDSGGGGSRRLGFYPLIRYQMTRCFPNLERHDADFTGAQPVPALEYLFRFRVPAPGARVEPVGQLPPGLEPVGVPLDDLELGRVLGQGARWPQRSSLLVRILYDLVATELWGRSMGFVAAPGRSKSGGSAAPRQCQYQSFRGCYSRCALMVAGGLAGC
ncbi:hypothetical protein LX36DRAFT_135998 [Colletotrichum falcatum]|nr:hypothetical protein LX36DRAFT_135998 [Colletotrichum falcatum]